MSAVEEFVKDAAARAHCGHWDGDTEALLRSGYQAGLEAAAKVCSGLAVSSRKPYTLMDGVEAIRKLKDEE